MVRLLRRLAAVALLLAAADFAYAPIWVGAPPPPSPLITDLRPVHETPAQAAIPHVFVQRPQVRPYRPRKGKAARHDEGSASTARSGG